MINTKDGEYILAAGYTSPKDGHRKVRGRLSIPPIVENQLKTEPQIVPELLTTQRRTNGESRAGYVLVTCRPVGNGSINDATSGAETRAVILNAVKNKQWEPLGEPVVVVFKLNIGNFDVAKPYLRGFDTQNGGTWQTIEELADLARVSKLVVNRRIALNKKFLDQT